MFVKIYFAQKARECILWTLPQTTNIGFAAKWMNTETVNYTAAYTLCLLVLFAVKQLCKVAFGLGAGAAVGVGGQCGCGCAAVLCTGEKFVFPGVATVSKQIGGFLFAAMDLVL